MSFVEMKPSEIDKNVIEMIAKQWMLITAGDSEKYNTMTASWGMMGYLWRKPVVNIYVRPTRYTYQFVEANDCFTLSFLKDGYRDALALLGSVSGRDGDKVKDSGLTPISLDGTVAFEESEYIFVCKKLYYSDISPDLFVDEGAKAVYEDENYHRCYTAEIIKVYKMND